MRTDALKGHLDGLVLATLAEGPAHGYAVIEELKRRSGGAFDLPEGTVYPVLYRLEAEGVLRERVVGELGPQAPRLSAHAPRPHVARRPAARLEAVRRRGRDGARVNGLRRELAARGIRGRLAARIDAELDDHLACDPQARLGEPAEIAEHFAVELRRVRTRRAASIGTFAALAATALLLFVLARRRGRWRRPSASGSWPSGRSRSSRGRLPCCVPSAGAPRGRLPRRPAARDRRARRRRGCARLHRAGRSGRAAAARRRRCRDPPRRGADPGRAGSGAHRGLRAARAPRPACARTGRRRRGRLPGRRLRRIGLGRRDPRGDRGRWSRRGGRGPARSARAPRVSPYRQRAKFRLQSRRDGKAG